jgi:hypothetical protein
MGVLLSPKIGGLCSALERFQRIDEALGDCRWVGAVERAYVAWEGVFISLSSGSVSALWHGCGGPQRLQHNLDGRTRAVEAIESTDRAPYRFVAIPFDLYQERIRIVK